MILFLVLSLFIDSQEKKLYGKPIPPWENFNEPVIKSDYIFETGNGTIIYLPYKDWATPTLPIFPPIPKRIK